METAHSHKPTHHCAGERGGSAGCCKCRGCADLRRGRCCTSRRTCQCHSGACTASGCTAEEAVALVACGEGPRPLVPRQSFSLSKAGLEAAASARRYWPVHACRTPSVSVGCSWRKRQRRPAAEAAACHASGELTDGAPRGSVLSECGALCEPAHRAGCAPLQQQGGHRSSVTCQLAASSHTPQR
jgi:hypothetical protein